MRMNATRSNHFHDDPELPIPPERYISTTQLCNASILFAKPISTQTLHQYRTRSPDWIMARPPPPTMTHYSRASRSIIYRARLDAVRALASFLVKDCCGSRPEICVPLIADFSPCCPPQTLAAKEAGHD